MTDEVERRMRKVTSSETVMLICHAVTVAVEFAKEKVLEERERCAKIADCNVTYSIDGVKQRSATIVAKLIRATGADR